MSPRSEKLLELAIFEILPYPAGGLVAELDAELADDGVHGAEGLWRHVVERGALLCVQTEEQPERAWCRPSHLLEGVGKLRFDLREIRGS
jgi:hypothetical protein